MAFDFAYLKEHPYVIGGIVLAGAVGLYLVTRSNSGSTATAGGLDANTAALYAAQAQTSAQLTAQNNQIAGQEQLATTQATYGIDIAQIQANAQTTQNNTAAEVALAQIAAQQDVSTQSIAAQLAATQINANVQITGLNDQLAGLQANDATTVAINQAAANEQMHIADTVASVQKAQINAQTTQSVSGGLFGLIGGLL